MIIDKIVKDFGVLKLIVSNRGSIFASKYQVTFYYYLAVKRRLFTAFYLQTNDQTERINQTLEVYLRCYLNFKQDNQVYLLSSAKFIINSSRSETISITPFQAIYLFELSIYQNIIREPLKLEYKTTTTRVAKIFIIQK